MKGILLLCFLFSAFSAWSQISLGKIVDAQTGEGIPQVVVVLLPDSTVQQSNSRGFFSYEPGGKFQFRRIGYESKIIQTGKSDHQLLVSLIPDPLLLESMIVVSQTIPVTLGDSPCYPAYIPRNEIQKFDPVNMSWVLNRSPGVFMHSGAINTNRITIRGIGARTPYSTNKVKAFFEGIPLTDGNGETTIEDLNMNNLGAIHIIRGPGSSLFGSGLGGAINIIRNRGEEGRNFSAETTYGSFGRFRGGFNLSSTSQGKNLIASLNHQSSEGYRDNNQSNRNSVMLAGTFYQERDKINVLAYYLYQNAFIPSSLDLDTYLNNPRSAAANWQSSRGNEEYHKLLIGVSWDHTFEKNASIKTTVFTNLKDANEARPFNILKESVYGFGVRSKFLKTICEKTKITSGLEYFQDWYGWNTYENKYKENPGQGSVLGTVLSDNKELRSYYNLFGELEQSIGKHIKINTGLNINQTKYKLEDFYLQDSINQSGDFKFETVLSPRISLSYALENQTTVFALMSHGFSPPSLEETLTPEGQLNPEIQPETGWNYEIGIKSYLRRIRTYYQLSIYSMHIKNLLVARRLAEDQYVGVNAGSTLHNGLEIGLSSKMVDKRKFRIWSMLSYTLADYSFKEFVDAGEHYSGNQLTGVPKQHFSGHLKFEIGTFFYQQIEFLAVAKMPLTDDNLLYSDSYSVLNLYLGMEKEFSNKHYLDLSFRVNNLFDEKYASMHVINASSFGGSAPRYYYPGLPINYQISLKWRLPI